MRSDTLALVKSPGVASLTKRMVDINHTSTFNLSLMNQGRFLNLEDIEVSADGSPVLRIIISIVYSAVCVVGLVGNLLVLFLMKVKQGVKRSSINLFVLNLAVTDFQFVLTLPFWAADTALDFSWPFGDAMCRIVLSVTVMNMYASVFFLTAMSVTRYRSVASALEERASGTRCSAPWVSAMLWLSASAATAPTFIFSSVVSVAGEKLCLLRFPEGQPWLALYHVQKIVVAFVAPMVIVSVCYLRLLRFIRRRSMRKKEPRSGCRVTRSRVTRSVTVVVLSFFLCWMPNHAITLWGVLVKFNVVRWDKSYYMIHTYVFPVSVCLAHVNSCLNPVLYCLMRREFRKMLKDLFWKISSPVISRSCPVRRFSNTFRPNCVKTHEDIPVNILGTEHCRLSTIHAQGGTSPAHPAEPREKQNIVH